MAATLESGARVPDFITKEYVERFLEENPQAASLAMQVRGFIGEAIGTLALTQEVHQDPKYKTAAEMLAAALRAA